PSPQQGEGGKTGEREPPTMFSLHRTLSLRYLRRRSSRTLLVVLSIALGVGTLVATRSLSDNMTQQAHRAVTPLAGIGDVLVSNGELGVPRDLADELKNTTIPGVKGVHPLVISRVALPELDNRPALLVGVDMEAEEGAENAMGLESSLLTPSLLNLPRGFPVYVGS